MWEENPKWQQANYRLLVWSIAVGVIFGFFISLWSGDWQPYETFLEALGVILAALCIYAAVIWVIGKLALKFFNRLKKIKNDEK